MPPQRNNRPRNYDLSVDPEAMHIEPEKLQGFGDAREVLKKAELDQLRAKAERADELEAQLNQALAEQGQSNALLVQDGALMVQGFQFSPTGLIPPENFSEEAWQQVGLLILKLEGSIQWLIGDWLVYGDQVGWGDLPKLAVTLGRDYDTLRNYANVSRKVKLWLRNHNLSYNHHRVAATLPEEKQEDALKYALKQDLSVSEFRKWVKGKSPENQHKFSPRMEFRSITSPLEKLIERDPSTFKPEEREAARRHFLELERWMSAKRREWGID